MQTFYYLYIDGDLRCVLCKYVDVIIDDKNHAKYKLKFKPYRSD